jgi:hypothetical protein
MVISTGKTPIKVACVVLRKTEGKRKDLLIEIKAVIGEEIMEGRTEAEGIVKDPSLVAALWKKSTKIEIERGQNLVSLSAQKRARREGPSIKIRRKSKVRSSRSPRAKIQRWTIFNKHLIK